MLLFSQETNTLLRIRRKFCCEIVLQQQWPIHAIHKGITGTLASVFLCTGMYLNDHIMLDNTAMNMYIYIYTHSVLWYNTDDVVWSHYEPCVSIVAYIHFKTHPHQIMFSNVSRKVNLKSILYHSSICVLY